MLRNKKTTRISLSLPVGYFGQIFRQSANRLCLVPTIPFASAQTNPLIETRTQSIQTHTTIVMSDIVGLRIPLATPPKTKAQLKVELAQFGERHKHLNGDYSSDIEVWNHQDTAQALLNRIAPTGSDPSNAAIL